MTEIPGKWADLLIKAGFTDRRNGAASLRRLGEASGVNVSTVSRLVIKGKVLTDANMQKIADALKVPVEELHRLATGVTAKPMTLPMGTEKLTEREKQALAEIIRALVNSKEHGDVDNSSEKIPEPAEQAEEKTVDAPDLAQNMHELAARKDMYGRSPAKTVRQRRKPSE